MNVGFVRTGRARMVGLIGTAALVATGFGFSVSAQDEDPTAGGHPAHIHVGTCQELDPNPLVPLNNVTTVLVGDDNDELPASEDIRGAIGAPQVEYSLSDGDEVELEGGFDALLETSHAINIHESVENIQTYIACGTIGGVVTDDVVMVALYPQNDSGYNSVARISKDGDNDLDVEIFLAPPAVEDVPEVEATPNA